MKKQIKSILAGVILIVLATASFAVDAADVGTIGVGARALGLSKAFTAVPDDSGSILTNPAGLGYATKWSVSTMQTKILDRANYQMISGALPTQYGTFGLAYLGVNTPAGYYNEEGVTPTADNPISFNDSLFVLSYGRDISSKDDSNPLGKIAVGVNLKSYSKGFTGYSLVEGKNASAFATDWGILVSPDDNTSYGVNLQNIGGNVSWTTGANEELASSAKLGGAWKIPARNLLVTSDIDFALSGAKPLTIKVGTEWTPNNFLSLRGGIGQAVAAQEDGSIGTDFNLSGGVGINVQGLKFDYAYKHDLTLADNSTHYFSLSLNPEFGMVKAAPKAATKTPVKQVNDYTTLTPIVPDAMFNAPEKSLKSTKKEKNKKYANVIIDADLASLMDMGK